MVTGLFNSCERLLLGALILDIKDIGILGLRYEHLSDLIHNITENGLRHSSGPVPSNLPSITFTSAIVR